jgi:hypothetical protein
LHSQLHKLANLKWNTTTKSHEDSDGSESTKPAPTPRRTFTFEAPMRPLDVARNMYLDYNTTQSIKFYNKGVKNLPSGEAFNGHHY